MMFGLSEWKLKDIAAGDSGDGSEIGDSSKFAFSLQNFAICFQHSAILK